MWLQMKCHLKILPMTGDGQLTGLLISQFIHWMSLTFGIHRGSCSTYFHITDYHCFGKIQGFTISHSNSQGTKFDWWKMGQGQPRVTLWTNLVVLSHLMLYIKFQSNPPRDSGKEGFWGFYHIWSWKPFWSFEQTLHPLLPRCCIWNLIEIGPVDSEKSFENVDKHSILVTLGQGHRMTLTFGIHRGTCSAYFHTRVPLFWKHAMYHLFPIQYPKGPNLTLTKMGQGQNRVTIWTDFVAFN